MNHLLNVLDGFASAFTWGPSGRTYPSTKGGFLRDQEKLSADARKVGADMEKALKGYDQQIGKGRGEKRQW